MPVERLVTMANQIGAYFASQHGSEAERRIADHLRRNWEPRMRRTIVAHAGQGGAGLEPAVLRAVRLLGP
jgi:formate dehydrogenase subunit delta